jgi:hypothetical protein
MIQVVSMVSGNELLAIDSPAPSFDISPSGDLLPECAVKEGKNADSTNNHAPLHCFRLAPVGRLDVDAPYTVRLEEVFPGMRLGRPLIKGCVAWLNLSTLHNVMKVGRQSPSPHGESAKEERNCLTRLKMMTPQGGD